jgi:hypothetical protein
VLHGAGVKGEGGYLFPEVESSRGGIGDWSYVVEIYRKKM